MSTAVGKRTNYERSHAAYFAGTATEEQIADMADMLMTRYESGATAYRCPFPGCGEWMYRNDASERSTRISGQHCNRCGYRR